MDGNSEKIRLSWVGGGLIMVLLTPLYLPLYIVVDVIDLKEVIGLMIAGMGLFFIGIRMIGLNLRMMAGRGFRQVLARLTNRGWLGAIVGVVAGGITQSTSAVTFIMTGMISAGLVSTRRAMPLVLWSNAGNCILVFLAVINFHIMILYLLGLVGFLYYCDLDKSKLLKPMVGGVLGVGLLFLGLDFIKSGSANLGEYSWIQSFIGIAEDSFLLGLLAAGVLSFFVQSAATVSAIAIALANTGVLTLEGTLMIIYGSNLGPGLYTMVLAKKLQGAPKRLAVFQVIFKLVGLTIFVSLFYLEVYGGVPLVMWCLERLTPDLEYQLAISYLVFQIVGSIILTISMDPVNRFLTKLYPESKEDALSKPKYMHDEALKEPDVAIALLEREQLRIINCFPGYFDGLRADSVERDNPRIMHAGTAVLCREVESYFHELLKKNLSQVVVEKTLNLQNRMEIIISLENSLYEVLSSVRDVALSERLEHFKHSVVEGSYVLMSVMVDVVREGDPHDRLMLWKMTEDRGDLMCTIHDEIREVHPELHMQEQQIFDVLSSRFERIIWMVRNMNRLVEEGLKIK